MTRRVLIGTPAHDGRADVWFIDSLLRTDRLLRSHGIECIPIFMAYDSLVQRARNDLVRLAVEARVDDLVFIDSDECWEPEWVLALLRHPVDCVGAAVRKKTDEDRYNVKVTAPLRDAATGLVVVEGLGTGFVRLSRRALTVLWEGSEPYRNEGRDCRMIFDVRVIDGELVSEDNIVCRKLAKAGIPVHLDDRFTVSHIGPKKWEGDIRPALSALPGEQTSRSQAPFR